MRKILMTAALPYANGDIHIGHLVEYIQADIWSRYQKLGGNECWFVCADDAHGTPIMLRAQAENTTPEQLVTVMREAHIRDFAAFNIEFDNYHSTHSEENRLLSEHLFLQLQGGGYIVEQEINQLYDEEKSLFLPDRYVRGECPKCQAADQYGDSCEACGAVYDSHELINPISTISNTPPQLKSSLHYFLKLSGEEQALLEWLESKVDIAAAGAGGARLNKQVTNKLKEWLEGGLHNWDISRDPPYFGFKIPAIPQEKYFYVWLDAPIGYLASFKNLCQKNNAPNFDEYCLATPQNANNATEMYHFIGKDILYFHGLFWPTMLKNSGFRQPTQIFVHGFLTVNGEKMSKSRGTFITAQTYLKSGLKPDCLRYYYASKLNDNTDDIDLSLADFKTKINSDLVGKLVNIPSRTANFLNKLFANTLDETADSFKIIDAATEEQLRTAYESRRYNEAVQIIMQTVDTLNAHIDSQQPWLMAKDPAQHAQLHQLCSHAIRAFDCLMGYLSPIIPQLASTVVGFLNRPPYRWIAGEGITPIGNRHTINRFTHLLTRIEDKHLNSIIQPAAAAQPAAAVNKAGAGEAGTAENEISIDDFTKTDIRIATVLDAATVEGSTKLLKLSLDIGDGTPRQVFSGISQHYQPNQLIGRQVVYLANLKPRKMRFGVSQGMVLAAENGDKITLLQPLQNTNAGAKVQ